MPRAKAARFLQKLHPNAPEMAFSQGWLKKFKDQHGSSHFDVLGKTMRWTWKQLARRYWTSMPLLMRTQRRTCSTWMKLASVSVSKPTTH
jgi:hypothetical protein